MITAMRSYRRALQVGLFVIIAAFVVTSVVVFGSGIGRDDRESIASVNGETIPADRYQRRYQEYLSIYAQNTQGRFTPEMAERFGVPLQVVDDLVTEALVMQRAHAEGFAVSDEELNLQFHAMPAFQEGGRFSMRRYEEILRRAGITKGIFEEDFRRKLTRVKIESAVRNGVHLSDAEVEQAYAQRHEEIRVAWALVEVVPIVATQSASDEELQMYLKDHGADFRLPERRRIQSVVMNPKDFTRPVPETAVEKYYTEHAAEFEAPHQVKASHILIRVPETGGSAAEDQAKVKAVDAIKRIKAGTNFATLAKELSQDPGSAKSGGDLGWISKGEMVPQFEQAVFALKKGELSPEPVRTPFGFHVIQVMDIRQGGKKPLKDVAKEIRAKLEGEAADAAARAKAEEVRPALQAAQDFGAEARKLGLTPTDSAVARRPSVAAPADPMEETAFSLAEGGVSTPVKTPGGWMVLRALETLPASVPPLAEIKDRVAAAVKRQKAEAVAFERAKQLAADAKGGDLTAAARKAGALIGETPRFSRTKPAERLPGDVMVAAFGTPVNGLSDPIKAQQGYYVLRVLERVPPDVSGLAGERETISRELLSRKQSQAWAAWVVDARSHAKVQVSRRFQAMGG